MTIDQNQTADTSVIAAEIASVINEQMVPALKAATDVNRGRRTGVYRQAYIEEVVLPALSTLLELSIKTASNLVSVQASAPSDKILNSLRSCFEYLKQIDFQKLSHDLIYCGRQQKTVQAFTDLLRCESLLLDKLAELAEAVAKSDKMRAHFATNSTKSQLVAVLKATTDEELQALPESLSTLQAGYHYEVETQTTTSIGIIQRGAYISFSTEEGEQFFDIFELPTVPVAQSV